jgi:hypothetical protein
LAQEVDEGAIWRRTETAEGAEREERKWMVGSAEVRGVRVRRVGRARARSMVGGRYRRGLEMRG